MLRVYMTRVQKYLINLIKECLTLNSLNGLTPNTMEFIQEYFMVFAYGVVGEGMEREL